MGFRFDDGAGGQLLRGAGCAAMQLNEGRAAVPISDDYMSLLKVPHRSRSGRRRDHQ
jgi:hypothetical protein